jgi:hypothetical protein
VASSLQNSTLKGTELLRTPLDGCDGEFILETAGRKEYPLLIMAIPEPQEVLKLATDIVSAKEHLASLQSRWDALFSGNSDFPKGGRKPDPDGISSRVLAAIEGNPDEHFGASDLERKLGIDRKKVERALNNLFVAKKITRHSRGNYEAMVISGD